MKWSFEVRVLCLIFVVASYEMVLCIDYTNDGMLTTPELIDKYGYDVETHNVVTRDGYILSLHRITGLKNRTWFEKLKRKPVVLISHGFLGSSADWIIFGPRRGLAYILSNDGYDVWLGNARGNRYSMAHKTLSIDQFEFWDFSCQEIGEIDLPAMIDYILKLTIQTKLSHCGLSQGGVIFNVMASELPEYNEKVSFVTTMASGYAGLNVTAIENIANFLNLYEIMRKSLGLKGLISHSLPQSIGSDIIFANLNSTLVKFFYDVTYYMIGSPIDKEFLPVVLGHFPSGGSVKQLMHYSQMATGLRKYDYGPTTNLQKYGQLIPPAYDVSKITTPMLLFAAIWDSLAYPAAVKYLSTLVKNLVGYQEIGCVHVGFITVDMSETVYKTIKDKMRNFKTCDYCFF